ncbi:uncharacterized protein LOC122497852 isoform X2 [Leptopilina heterotoma]|uniref:uncharacterized protein LOC122497852 isoform X2 n=1 Tax=Leptopilina heterotoma TaxID=63436 RepID=UPI001CA92138|nr:uncharacterized protein LOC122497852 isoform X2 [Leptopilina heterotoma]
MSDKYQIKVSTSFPTVTDAKIIYDVISVDKGPRRSGTTRILSVNDNSVEACRGFVMDTSKDISPIGIKYFNYSLRLLDLFRN